MTSLHLRYAALAVVAFCIGFNYHIITLPCAVALFSYNFLLRKEAVLKSKVFVILFLLFLSVGVSLIVGSFDEVYGRSAAYSMYIMFLLVLMVSVVSMSSQEQAFIIIFFYSLGAYVNSFLTIVSACVMGVGLDCGYGSLYSFLDSKIVNTPNYANMTMPFLSFVIGYFFVYRPSVYSYKFLTLVFLIMTSVGILSFLSSRAAYVSIAIVMVVSYILGGRYRAVDALLVLSLCIVLYIGAGLLVEYGFASFERLIDRFDETGLNTPRFERYYYAINGLLENPVGTYQLPNYVASSNLVHNIYFDLAKHGGWLVFFSFLVFTALGCLQNPFSRNKKYRIMFVLYVVTWCSLQQDVFFGPGLPVLIAFVMSVTYLFVFSRRAFNKERSLA